MRPDEPSGKLRSKGCDQVDQELLNEINAAYYRLETKQAEIVRALPRKMFELVSGWYNGHYHRNGAMDWVRESFPIPVVSVNGLCDIEIQFDGISVSAKLKRDAALAYHFEKFAGYEFEAYGVGDYLADFCHPEQSAQEMKERIRASEETEIGFSFAFPFEIEGMQIFEFVMLLRREGFYY